MKDEIKRLRAHVKAHGSAELAAMLGYKSSSTISHWLKKNRIPAHALERVRVILKEV